MLLHIRSLMYYNVFELLWLYSQYLVTSALKIENFSFLVQAPHGTISKCTMGGLGVKQHFITLYTVYIVLLTIKFLNFEF